MPLDIPLLPQTKQPAKELAPLIFCLDGRQRPHRLYVGEGFYRADFKSQERFLDIFSNYLAGQPDKFVLIYLFDANTNNRMGEYGFDGFKLYSTPMRTAKAPQKIA